MIINIRLGVFETNSSSAHSIVMTNSGGEFTQEEIEKSLRVERNGILLFNHSSELEFCNSPFDVLYTPREKVCYLYASYNLNEEKINEINNAVRELAPKTKEIKFENIFALDDENPMDCHGFVDHQSANLINSYLTKNNISIKDFIAKKCYVIIIDGDEYDVLGRMKLSGLLNNDIFKDTCE